MTTEQQEMFERAFSPGIGSCVGTCECGRQFYDSYGSYSWEENEIEELQKAGAESLAYSVSYVEFEGKTYCSNCDCWHNRADKIINFIESHGHGIAGYLTLVKERKTKLAELSPTVR